DPSNWGGTLVPATAVELPNVKVTPVDDADGTQWAARQVTFSGAGQFYAQGDAAAGEDLQSYLGSNATLTFDARVDQAPAGAVKLRVDCVYPCIGEVDVTSELAARADGNWHTLKLPLQCFAAAGTDFSNINTPFLMF